MNFAGSIANDLASFDGAETILLTTASGVSITVPGAIAQELSPGSVELTANVLTSEVNVCAFHLMVSALEGVEPASGDVILDSRGRRWRVQTSHLATLASRYQLQCTRES